MSSLNSVIYIRTQALWSSPCFDALQEHRCRIQLNMLGLPQQEALVIREPVTGPDANFHGLKQMAALIASGTIKTLLLPDLEHLCACRNLDPTLPQRIRCNGVRVVLAKGGEIVVDGRGQLFLLPWTPAAEAKHATQAQHQSELLRVAREWNARLAQEAPSGEEAA